MGTSVNTRGTRRGPAVVLAIVISATMVVKISSIAISTVAAVVVDDGIINITSNTIIIDSIMTAANAHIWALRSADG